MQSIVLCDDTISDENTLNMTIDDGSVASESVVSVTSLEYTFTPIQELIAQIEEAADTVTQLNSLERDGNQIEKHLATVDFNDISNSTAASIRQVKQLLDSAKERHIYQQSACKQTKSLWYSNMYNTCVARYRDSIILFQKETKQFKISIGQEFTEHAKSIHPTKTPQQIQQMMQQQKSDNQLDSISENTIAQHEELCEEQLRLQTLAQTMTEIQELFEACAVIVSETQEHLDNIDTNVEQAQIDLESGRKHIKQAEQYTVETRKVK